MTPPCAAYESPAEPLRRARTSANESAKRARYFFNRSASFEDARRVRLTAKSVRPASDKLTLSWQTRSTSSSCTRSNLSIFSLEEHAKATEGVECRKDEDVIDETPGAYKDIDAVMAAQSELVEVVHTLKQVVCVKG